MAAAPSLQDRLNDPDYKNWLKIGQALKYVQEGIGGFTEKHARAFHSTLLQTLGPTKCGRCKNKEIEKK